MKIIDLTEEYQDKYFVCLDDWSPDMKEAGNHKELWYHQMKDKGLRVKLALHDGNASGLIQYLPIEHSFVDGQGLYFITCIWVHGHQQGIGNQQKKGLGRALLQAAEDDVKSNGAKGMAAWGLSLPFWMKASWFKKQGYVGVDKDGMAVLLWKPFAEDAIPPKWIKQKRRPAQTPGKVAVRAFVNGWCPVQNFIFERAKRASAEFDDKVLFEEIHTLDRDVLLDWGITDGVFIDGEVVRKGPPPSYKSIKKKIAKRVRKLR